jgi:hypothetical protein
VQVARTLVIRDQLRATKVLVCGKNIPDFCHSCREQQISNMLDIFCHSWQNSQYAAKQLIATLRSKEVRMRDIPQNNKRTSFLRKVAMNCLPHTRNFCHEWQKISHGWIHQGFSSGWWVSSRVFLYNYLGGGGRAFKWIGFLTTWVPKAQAP